MADKVLSVKLNATDGVSGPLKKIATSATQTGNALESAGKEAKAGFDDVKQGAEDATRSMDELKSNATAIGAVLGTLATGAIKAGAAYRDMRLDIQSLESQYGSAADGILAFTEVMQDSLNTSNDAARDTALTFATLFRNYEFGETQIQALMERTADVSSARGRNAVEVSQMIQNALRGEAEYIEQIGVTLNDTFVASEYAARGLGNWNTLTDEAAKAQFRYVLLMEQTVDTQGRAAEEAARAGGRFREFLNEVQDAGQAVGQFLGPVGEVAAEMAPIAMALPVITAGLGRMAGALRTSTIASTALGVAFNPITLGLTAVVAGGALMYEAFTRAGESTRALDQELGSLADTIESLKLSGETGLATEAQTLLSELTAITDAMRDGRTDIINEYFGTAFESQTEMLNSAVYQDFQRIMDMSDEFAAHINQTMSTLTAEQQQVYLEHVNAMIDSAVTTMEGSNLDDIMRDIMITPASEIPGVMDAAAVSVSSFSSELERLRTITGGSGAGGELDEFTLSVNRIEAAIKDGSLSVRDLEAYLADLDYQMATGAISWAQYQEGIANADDALLGMAGSAESGSVALSAAHLSLEEATVAAEEHAAAQEEARAAIAETGAAAGQFALDIQAANDAAREMTVELGSMAGEFATEEIEAYNDALRETIATVLELSGNADITSQLNMTSAASQASELAEAITDVGAALDNQFRIVVSNTNAIGSQMQGIKDWSDDLIGDPGYWAEIDDLLAEGRISLEKYNEAQAAQVTIAQANAIVQRDILAIQAAQAPLLATGAENMADYVQHLRAMNDGFNDTATGAQDQLAVLALMDQGYQNQLLQVMQMADALDDLGPSGEAAFASMIDGMVALDPAMAAVLEKVGLIDNVVRDQDGRILSYDVQIDGADGAMSEIERLTLSIDALTVALGGVPPDVPVNVDVTGLEDVEAAEQSVQNLITSATQDAVISITTRLAGPTTGDGTAGPVYDGEPIPIPATPVFGDGTAGPVYEGPAVPVPTDLEPPEQPPADWFTQDPVEIPTELLPPDIPVEFWTPEPVRIPVELDFSGLGAGVSGAAGDALAAAQSISIPAPDTSEALAAVQEVQDAITGLNGASATITITGDYASAQEAVEYARSMHGGDWWGNYTVYGDYSSATEAVEYTRAVHGADWWGNYTVYGDYSSVVDAVEYARQFHGAAWSGTYTLTAVTVGDIGPGTGGRGGGIVGNLSRFAGGGMVEFIGGEAGPELAHFVGGGLASLPVHGIYSAPAGTYISPAHTTASTQHSGGGDIVLQITVEGDVYGIQDLTERVTRELAPALASAIRQKQRSLGG